MKKRFENKHSYHWILIQMLYQEKSKRTKKPVVDLEYNGNHTRLIFYFYVFAQSISSICYIKSNHRTTKNERL